jgi:hypothetical protein
VVKHLSKQYTTLADAEESLEIDYVRGSIGIVNPFVPASSTPCSTTVIDEPLSPMLKSAEKAQGGSGTDSVGYIVKEFITCYKNMSSRLRKQIINYLLQLDIIDQGGHDFFNFVNRDFIEASLDAMLTLFHEGKHNIIYNLCECLKKDSNATTRMPLDRMPYGLIDYNIRFYASMQTRQLRCEEHYASWMETMFAHFGHKWLSLHRGPAWQFVESSCDDTFTNSGKSLVEIALDASGIDLDGEIGTCSMLNDLSLSVASEETQGNESLDITLENLSINAESVVAEDSPLEHENLSTLWTSITDDDVCEIQSGQNNYKDMERHHGVQPVMSKRKRNSGLFDPLKVCKPNLTLCHANTFHLCHASTFHFLQKKN